MRTVDAPWRAPSGEAQAEYLEEFFASCAAAPCVRRAALWERPTALYQAATAHTNTDYCMYAKPGAQVVASRYAIAAQRG